jgi:hypothetical protein
VGKDAEEQPTNETIAERALVLALDGNRAPTR